MFTIVYLLLLRSIRFINQQFICYLISLLYCASYMFFLYCSLSSQDYSVIDALRNRVDKFLSAHSRANTFVFSV